jgi:hypothetical protein
VEVENLFRSAIETLACFGADVNNPKSMAKIGLGVSFSPTSGVKIGGSGLPTATYGPQPQGGFGFTFDGGQPSLIGVAKAQDPLGSVYGPTEELKDPRYTMGAGDPLYGYPSDFGGPGFGQAGFGAFGGLGFGSGLGATGDPGFKDITKFTYAGFGDARGAMERFQQDQGKSCRDEYFATAGIDEDGNEYSDSGKRKVCSTNTSSKIEGKVTAFAIASAPGILDPTANARSKAEAISERQRAQRFGFANDNPYGVPCLETKSSREGPFVYEKHWKLP